MLTETLLQNDKKLKNINFAICIVSNKHSKKILDLRPIEWMKKELKHYNLFVLESKVGEELREKIKLYCSNFEFFFIIYDKTPYITSQLIDNVIEYMIYKNSKACKLHCGAVYNTSYYLSTAEPIYDNFYMQSSELFTLVETDEQIALAEKYFSKKIVADLQRNNVKFENPNSVIISANTIVEKNCIIFSNCVFRGKNHIGQNSIINNNTTIIDSKIGMDSSVSNSIIYKSKIGNNVIISPYCDIKKSKISNDCIIGYYCLLDNYTLKRGEVVKDRTTLKKESTKEK